MQAVLTATFNWLLNNKASAKVVVLPNIAAAQYFVDLTHGNTHRLGLNFQDVTYDILPGATDLVAG